MPDEDLITDAAPVEGTPTADTTPPAADAAPAEGAQTNEDKPLDKEADNNAQQSQSGDLLSDDGAADDEGVPDQYTFDAPEELKDIQFDTERLDAFKDVAKEMGLSQKQFQKIVEYDLSRGQAATEAAVNEWNTQVGQWRQQAQTDKEIGGESFKDSIRLAQTAVDQFGDADLKALLKSPSPENPNGLAIGNHPAVLRMLRRIGERLSDPSFVEGDASQKDAGTLQRMYPSMFKNSA